MRRWVKVNVGLIVPAEEPENDSLDNNVVLMCLEEAFEKKGVARLCHVNVYILFIACSSLVM